MNSSLTQDSLVIVLTGNYNITLIGGINYLAPSTATYLLTLPAITNGIITIINTSGYTQTLFHSSLITGTYGSNANTLSLYNNNIIKLYRNTTNWCAVQPWATFTTILKSGNYNVISGIASVIPYGTYVRGTAINSAGLGYAAGLFTNNSGTTMNLNISVWIGFSGLVPAGNITSCAIYQSVLGTVYTSNIVAATGLNVTTIISQPIMLSSTEQFYEQILQSAGSTYTITSYITIQRIS